MRCWNVLALSIVLAYCQNQNHQRCNLQVEKIFDFFQLKSKTEISCDQQCLAVAPPHLSQVSQIIA